MPECVLSLQLNWDQLFFCKQCLRARIQNVLLKSNVLTEVQRSLHESALHVEDLPIDPSSQSASQPQSSRDMSSQSLSSEMAIGGPAGLWHFIYKSVYLDQYVSSEFPSSISNRKQQKRYVYWWHYIFISIVVNLLCKATSYMQIVRSLPKILCLHARQSNRSTQNSIQKRRGLWWVIFSTQKLKSHYSEALATK